MSVASNHSAWGWHFMLLCLLQLGFCFAYTLTGLVYAATITVNSSVQLLCCIWRTFTYQLWLLQSPYSFSCNGFWVLVGGSIVQMSQLRAKHFAVSCFLYFDQVWVSMLIVYCIKKFPWWELRVKRLTLQISYSLICRDQSLGISLILRHLAGSSPLGPMTGSCSW